MYLISGIQLNQNLKKKIKKKKDLACKLLLALNIYIPPRRRQDYLHVQINEPDTGEYNALILHE